MQLKAGGNSLDCCVVVVIDLFETDKMKTQISAAP